MSRAVVLVEGVSDKNAIEALASRHGRDLGAEDVAIVAMGGASALGSYLAELVPQADVRLAGLCDEREADDFKSDLERAGFGVDLSRSDMETLGFYVCVRDLEDELIRALGTAAVEDVIESQGELGAFRTLQHQPAWKDRRAQDQLRRWFGAGARRKARYAGLLVEALDLDRTPSPLAGVIARV